MKEQTLTQGKILKSLILFAFPVLIALFLQAMYGAADLIIVGKFAGTNEQSGVASGSQLFNMITMIITGLTMGITVFVGDAIGANKKEKAGKGIGSGIIIFAVIAIIITLIIVPFSDLIAGYMHAPKEAFKQTSNYIRICAMGTIFIVAYNCIGAIFRGIGDSKTPLITVAIATVSSQAISVIFSLYFISKKKLPFNFSKKYIRLEKECVKKILIIGSPIALQEMLVQFSFLFIQVIVNGMGVMESAAVGVAEKVCVFLMLVASAYMQSISAFVAQNNGAGLYERSQKALIYGIRTALIAGMFTSIITLVFGSLLSNIFSNERLVILASYSYLKAYAIDCLLTAILFCFVGYFNGCGKTLFVMIQGIVGAFFVRIPVVYLMSHIDNASLFYIGLATPISSVVQIILCLIAYNYYKRDLYNSEKLEKSYSTI